MAGSTQLQGHLDRAEGPRRGTLPTTEFWRRLKKKKKNRPSYGILGPCLLNRAGRGQLFRCL